MYNFFLKFGINSKPQISIVPTELPFKIYIFFYKPFASPKQKHLLNSNVWNKFKTSNFCRSYGTTFQNLHFFYKPFASTKQFLKINIDFLKKATSPILQFSHSQALPLKINALPTNFYQRLLPPKAELLFPRQIPFRFL